MRRPVEYRDIAVLYRSATGLDSLEEALRANDVPYQVSGGRYYYARMEFQDLLSMLKAIDNPFDGLSVVGALRSPFFGQSDEDLLRHFGAGGHSSTISRVRPQGCRDLAEAFDALKDLHERRRRDPASAVLARLFESTRALLIYANKPHGEQRVANLLKLQEIARAMAEAEVSSFSALVRRLSEMESSRQAESESPIAEADENFVQVMTFHKAKGLEFPVVVLAHLANEGENREKVLLDRARGRLHLNLDHRKTRDWDAAMTDEEDRAEHERRRMFYVALTRARDLLVIPAFWSKSPQAGFLKYLGERYAPARRGRSPRWSSSRRTPSTSTSAAATRCGSSRRRRPRCRRRRSNWRAITRSGRRPSRPGRSNSAPGGKSRRPAVPYCGMTSAESALTTAVRTPIGRQLRNRKAARRHWDRSSTN